jgi:hypothetical protein
METWTLYTFGRLHEGFSETSTREQLSKIGVPEKQISLLFSGKKLTLKQQATLKEVKQLSAKFKRCGLQTHVALTLDHECLKAGLQFRSPKTSSPPQTKPQWETVILPEKYITPSLISMPGESDITDENNKKVGFFTNATYFWQPLPLVIGLLITGVNCETYFVRLLSEIMGWRLLATVIGLTLLGIATFILPRFLQPLTGFSIESNTGKNSLITEEQSVFYLSKRRYNIINDDGNVLAIVERKASSATMEFVQDLTLFYWNKAFTHANLGDSAVEEIQNNVVRDEGMPFIPEHFHWLRRIKKVFTKKPSPSDINWTTEAGLVILDQDNCLKAIVYQEPIPAIRFKSNMDNTQKNLLMAFAVCLLRSHLV